MYDFNNDIWLCHSFRGQCYNYTAFVSMHELVIREAHDQAISFNVAYNLLKHVVIWHLIHQQPAVNVLKEIQNFLEANPSEIITIFIEDYVTSPKGLTKVFDSAGLRKYWFPVSGLPKNGGNWPTVDAMVQKNQRLVVFTSKASKEASEGIAYEWRYVVENQCKSYYMFSPPLWFSWTEDTKIFHYTRANSDGVWTYRWEWRDERRFVSEPSRIIFHEHNFKVACLSELFSRCAGYNSSLQG
jgi:hypothetical protein